MSLIPTPNPTIPTVTPPPVTPANNQSNIDAFNNMTKSQGGGLIVGQQGTTPTQYSTPQIQTTTPAPIPTTVQPTPNYTPPDPNQTQIANNNTKITGYQNDYENAKNDFQNQLKQNYATLEGIRTGSIPLSPYEQAQIDNSKTLLQSSIDAQKLENKNYEGGVAVANERRGLSRYSPEMAQGNIFAAVSEGNRKVADLNAKMGLTLAQMETGFRDSDFNKVKSSFELLTQAKNDRIATIDKMQQQVQAENDKIIKRQQEEILGQVYSTLNNLTLPIAEREAVVNKAIASGKLSTEQIKTLQDDIRQGREDAVTNKLNQDKFNRDLANDKYDNAYKQAQINKIYADIKKDSEEAGVEPNQVMAYAQQYASTGQIPVGLPKGTFGLVSAAAKELPKGEGTIVDKNTGVKSSAVPAALETGYASMYSVIELAKELKELDKKRIGGITSGTLGKIFGSDDQQKYIDKRDQIVDLLARSRTGAAINTSEEELYSGMLPGRFSEAFFLGVDSQSRLDNFIDNVSKDLNNKTKTQGLSIFGFSKVNLGGKEYTVGDIIHNGSQAGRVNPDGTITLISE